MANKVFNMAGGKHSAAAYSAFENAMYGSCVASDSDFVATAGTGMNVSLSKGNGLIDTGLEYARRIQSDATQTIAISAASSANPRKDAIVAYIDNSVAPSTSYTDNTNNILKFTSVDGTPAANPSAPSAATIQTAVGAGNPYVVLWHVLVPKSATSLTAATFTRACRVANMTDTANIRDGGVTTAKLASAAVDSSKLDWTSIFAKTQYAGSPFTTTSTTMADKITMTGVPKGRYLIQGMTAWDGGQTNANGECNMRFAIVSGGTTTNTDTNTVFMPPTGAAQWSGITNVFQAMVDIANDNSTIKLQTSVNWPSRGTFTCRSTSYISAIRIGEATS